MIPNLVRSLLFACATVFIVKHLPEQFIIRAGLIKCVQVGFYPSNIVNYGHSRLRFEKT